MGQKGGEWTEAMNTRLLKKMDTNGDGTINSTEFCSFFEKALPVDTDEFNSTLDEFLLVARECRLKKKNCKKSSRRNSLSSSYVSSYTDSNKSGNAAADDAKEAQRLKRAEMRKATAEANAANDRLSKVSNADDKKSSVYSSPRTPQTDRCES